MLTAAELRAKIESYKQDGSIALELRNFLSEEELPTWEDFINHVDTAVHRQSPHSRINNPLMQRAINSSIQTGLFYLMSEINDQDEDQFFSRLKPIGELLHELFPGRNTKMSSAFFNLVGDDAIAPKHRDNTTDNFFVNCRGRVVWKLFRNREDLFPETELELQPGDAIFITRDVYHEVSAPAARASVIFRIDVPQDEVIPGDAKPPTAASAKENEERPATTTLQEKD